MTPSSPATGHRPLPYHFHEFLPAIYQRPEGDFVRRFLSGLEPTWTDVEAHLADPSRLVSPRTAPDRFLPWLAGWIGLTLDQNWPERKQRLLLQEAVDLYQLRGTSAGLCRFLEIYTGVRPGIVEPFDGGTFGAGTLIGQAILGDVPAHCFTVTVFLRPDEEVDEGLVEEIVEMEKPAHTACRIRCVRLTAGPELPAAA